MNKIVNTFLLAGDTFMSKLHLTELGLTYSVCGLLTKHCKKVQKFKVTGSLKHFYMKELDKACFTHDAAYFASKN